MSQHVASATDQSFAKDVLQSLTPALVDFWAEWCGPCRALAPVVEEIAEENAGKIRVFKLNVDDNPETAAKYGVRGIPTLLFFKGGEVAHQSVGVVAKASLQSMIDKLTG